MGEKNIYPILENVFVIVNLLILTLYLPFYITLFVLLPLTLKIYAKLTAGLCKSIRRLDGQTVIVTGANRGKYHICLMRRPFYFYLNTVHYKIRYNADLNIIRDWIGNGKRAGTPRRTNHLGLP
jgi:hypothetical protein